MGQMLEMVKRRRVEMVERRILQKLYSRCSSVIRVSEGWPGGNFWLGKKMEIKERKKAGEAGRWRSRRGGVGLVRAGKTSGLK